MPQQAFKLVSDNTPRGDQPAAIAKIVEGINAGVPAQTLLGVTGSGKTFTMAQVVAAVNRPTLIMAPNKTLAAQLFGEFKRLFPFNAVEYFVSYYDYYLPEAYIPSTDTYIDKDSMINDRLDRLRHSATRSLLDRQDVLIVASVSCIFGLGSPEAYEGALLYAEKGVPLTRQDAVKKLVEIQYTRNDMDLKRGTWRARGDVLDVYPIYEDAKLIRFEFFGDDLDHIWEIDPLTGEVLGELDKITVYPATHYVTPKAKLQAAVADIRAELVERVQAFKTQGKLLEAQRLEQRTKYDLELIEEIGSCKGIENYSRHFERRGPGSTPPTLMSYLPKNALIMVDESHVTIPQIGGMYRGDRARKTTLVEYGFRLPSALDNRPLTFEEFEGIKRQTLYVSATPGPYELEHTKDHVVEQIVRPTGLIDPVIDVLPARGQVDDVIAQIQPVIKRGERALVCTLTKRMAEELSDYLKSLDFRVRYLHAEIDTLERMEILRDLRKGEFDILVGINLLREGLDLPEVSLICILDADKEGYLRSQRSLIQMVGRAARNLNGRVVFYGDKITGSMQYTIDETNRRRRLQLEYNKQHKITPKTVINKIDDVLGSIFEADYVTVEKGDPVVLDYSKIFGKGNHGKGHPMSSRTGVKGQPPTNANDTEEALGAGRNFATRRALKAAEDAGALNGRKKRLIEKGILPPESSPPPKGIAREVNPADVPKLIGELEKEMFAAAKELDFERAALLRDELRALQKIELGIK
ncbi:MAG: excinuclease ABC subunit UvrB [Planctomycetes bacterium]|nr:excinuclease ABC subunit UvrB [Planctomycetota bacterium]